MTSEELRRQIVSSMRSNINNEAVVKELLLKTRDILIENNWTPHGQQDFLEAAIVEAYSGINRSKATSETIKALTSITSSNPAAAQEAAERLLADIAADSANNNSTNTATKK